MADNLGGKLGFVRAGKVHYAFCINLGNVIYCNFRFYFLSHITKIYPMKSKQQFVLAGIIMLILFFMTSCAPGNEKFDVDPAGFLYGLWHGFISLISFIVSLFNHNVHIYEIENSGWAYDLGFIIGASIFYGGSSRSGCRKR